MNPLESSSVDTNGNGESFMCIEWLIPCFSHDTADAWQFAYFKVGMPIAFFDSWGTADA